MQIIDISKSVANRFRRCKSVYKVFKNLENQGWKITFEDNEVFTEDYENKPQIAHIKKDNHWIEVYFVDKTEQEINREKEGGYPAFPQDVFLTRY